MEKQDVGVIGIGVMGKSLALNLESKGYSVSIFDVMEEKITDVLKEHGNKQLHGYFSIESFVKSLQTPRKIMMMVQAGEVTDKVIESVLPFLMKKDILIDGGNTYFLDTLRRHEMLEKKGVYFIGAGISGGEEGALTGPSIMPGGKKEAYALIEKMLIDISAKVDGEPCCTYIGPNGAGHYVKMVHNGIEYGDMQLICEAYSLMKNILHMSNEQLHETFASWNEGELNSYLIEITAEIFTKKDLYSGDFLIDFILDTAGQKGTGKWTSKDALDLGIPLPIITESVFARFLSSLKKERVYASKELPGPNENDVSINKKEFLESIRQGLYMSKICSYAQGFAQLNAASAIYNWNLNLSEIAKIFRGGCIIRAAFLENIKEAYEGNPSLANLLLDTYFKNIVSEYQVGLRQIVSVAALQGIPVPCFSAALAYYDSYRSEFLPANLLQAQRDYFGAHTYQRIDREGTFHTNWQEK